MLELFWIEAITERYATYNIFFTSLNFYLAFIDTFTVVEFGNAACLIFVHMKVFPIQPYSIFEANVSGFDKEQFTRSIFQKFICK
jgi:hypothetical protein